MDEERDLYQDLILECSSVETAMASRLNTGPSATGSSCDYKRYRFARLLLENADLALYSGPANRGSHPPGSSEIGYSLGVRRVLGAGSRAALPLRFSVIFEYGGLIP
jgi:hypothetical protein